jgi:hypothetical protein
MIHHLNNPSRQTRMTMSMQTIWPAIPLLQAGKAGMRTSNLSPKAPIFPHLPSTPARNTQTHHLKNSRPLFWRRSHLSYLSHLVAVREDLSGLRVSVVKSAKIKGIKPNTNRHKPKNLYAFLHGLGSSSLKPSFAPLIVILSITMLLTFFNFPAFFVCRIIIGTLVSTAAAIEVELENLNRL